MPTDIIFEIKVMFFAVFVFMFSALYYAVPKMYEEAVKPGNEFLKRMWQVKGEEETWVRKRRRVLVVFGVFMLVMIITF
ncbi:MAG TPA: hypothetical protein VGH19_02270 [Verrucomicrobiae bacterium]